MLHDVTIAGLPCKDIEIGINGIGGYHGGIVRIFEQIVESAARDHQVAVWYAPPGASIPTNVVVKSLQSNSRKRTFRDAIMRAFSATEHIDVRVDLAQGFLLRVKSRKRVQIVCDLGFLDRSNPHVDRFQRIYRAAVTRWGLRHSDLVICISDFTASEAKAFMPSVAPKIVSAPLPVDYIFASLPDDFLDHSTRSSSLPRTILAFGHAENKGVKTLLELIDKYPDYQLRIICPRKLWDRSGYQRMAERLGVDHKIQVLGNISDIELIREYQHADLFCMPSQYEGYGLPVAEALACARPTVISDLDVLESTGRGYASRAQGWGADALAVACTHALSRPHQHWHEASHVFKQWTWNSWVTAMLEQLDHRPTHKRVL